MVIGIYTYQRSFDFNIHVQGFLYWELRPIAAEIGNSIPDHSRPPPGVFAPTCTDFQGSCLVQALTPQALSDPSNLLGLLKSILPHYWGSGDCDNILNLSISNNSLQSTVYYTRHSEAQFPYCVTVSTNPIRYASYRRKRWARGQGALAALLSWDNSDLRFHD